MIHNHNLSEEQKDTITEWVEENSEYEQGELVTVNYTGEGVPFGNSEYGGIPLRVVRPTWRGVRMISGPGLYHYEEEDDVDLLLKLYEDDEGPDHPHADWTPYVKPEIEYDLNVAVDSRVECTRSIEQAALVRWEDYEGNLQFSLRDDHSTVSLRDGSDCPVCDFSAERVAESHLPDGTPYGRTSCAVCGYVKEQHSP